MNDLFTTNSFKKYTDLKLQTQMDDIEPAAGGGGDGGEAANLQKFFEDVDGIKEEMKHLEQLYALLRNLNEETKIAHSAKTMKNLRAQMDMETEKILRRAKAVKQKLETLDESNAACRNAPGCGPGSSADRTRTSVVAAMGTKLKNLMDDFQSLRSRIASEYRETVERRYYTVTGERPDEEMIETLISTGESESFLQKAIQEQGRGKVIDTISEIQERHGAVKEIERSLMDLHNIFLDMAALVEAQGHQFNDIESHVAHARSFVRRGAVELEVAKEVQKSSRKWYCIAFVLGALLVAILLLPVLSTLFRPN
ncbi:Syntaxin-124 [Platanthera guangdongensis]|uniref:Syntaxin-124 n=1 Tax=Platanthera guangdongensis TaxID=2320717 RepID=A0ABR2LJ55_9ASPA